MIKHLSSKLRMCIQVWLLQFRWLQRVGHDLVTKQQQNSVKDLVKRIKTQAADHEKIFANHIQ